MATTDIRTTQNVTIEYELASLRERFFAFIIDLMIYSAVAMLLFFTVAIIFGDSMTEWGFRFFFLLIYVGITLYHLVSEMLGNGCSLGKRAVNIKVVRLDGREPGFGEYLLRAVFLLVDFVFSGGVLGGVLIGSTFKCQRMGDIAANTTVIRVKNQLHFRLNDILKINTLDNYEPKYPAVKQMSESDMLLLKNLLARYQTWGNDAHAQAIRTATQNICQELSIEPPKGNQIEFLKTLIRDYIVLTR